MKKAVIFLCTTGLTLMLLAAVGNIFIARFLCVESVFQSAAVNIIIHIGLMFLYILFYEVTGADC